MPYPSLTQNEADALIAMEKMRTSDTQFAFPLPGRGISIPLVSIDKRETFILDLSQQEINLKKIRYQNRARQVFVLVRLDLGGSPHRNPDGTEIGCPHLHVYKEGFGDKWAIPVPPEEFPRLAEPWGSLQDFMRYCNITSPPEILQSIFQ